MSNESNDYSNEPENGDDTNLAVPTELLELHVLLEEAGTTPEAFAEEMKDG